MWVIINVLGAPKESDAITLGTPLSAASLGLRYLGCDIPILLVVPVITDVDSSLIQIAAQYGARQLVPTEDRKTRPLKMLTLSYLFSMQ